MVLKIIDNKEQWDDFIDSNKYALLFHKWDFLKTVEKYSDFKVQTYGIFNDSQLIGVVPLFYNKVITTKMLFSPPPRAVIPYLGFLIFNEYITYKQDKKEKFLHIINNEINNIFHEQQINYISMSLIPEIIDIRPFIWDNYEVKINYTYIIDTSRRIEDIWSSLKKETRKKIKEAQKADIKIQFTDNSDYIFEKIQERYNDQKLNVPIMCKDYLADLKKYFPDNIIIKKATLNDETIGSEITIEYNGKHIDWLGGVRPSVDYPVNELMIWNSLERCKELNIREMDMVGANHRLISEFKAQFNPTVVPTLQITKKDLRGKLLEFTYRNLIKRQYF